MARRVDEKNALRAWFRLLLIHRTISRKIGVHFRSQFDISTARFDTLAQLHAAGGEMTMGELSSQLMVTSGNVTGLVDGMVADHGLCFPPLSYLVFRAASRHRRSGRLNKRLKVSWLGTRLSNEETC